MPSPKQKKILLLIAWGFATYLLFLCFREIELEQAWNNIKQAHPLWLFLGIAGHFLIFIFWAKQWIIFLPGKVFVTFKEMFEINALMSTAMNTLPFPGGHAFGVFLLAKKEGVVFIPAHLAEKVVVTSEIVRLRDLFGISRLKEGKYTPGEIDNKWSDAIEKDFSKWLKEHIFSCFSDEFRIFPYAC